MHGWGRPAESKRKNVCASNSEPINCQGILLGMSVVVGSPKLVKCSGSTRETCCLQELNRAAARAGKQEQSERLKIKGAIEKGNFDGARIYSQNAINKKKERINYMQLASRLEAVVSR